MKEEIHNEALTRKVGHFIEFLDLMALSNGEELNYQSLASDTGVSAGSIKNYIQVLEDTLIAFQLNAFTKTRKRKAISRSKLYFFDVGVTNSLANRGEIREASELFGRAFEHFILMEVRAYLSYQRINEKMCYWRSVSQFEVDLIIGQKWAVEVKGAKIIHDKHLKGLRALKEEGIIEHYAVVSLDRLERETPDGISIFPWKVFLRKLWSGELM